MEVGDLELLKMQLQIEEDYKEDDAYLSFLFEASEQAVARHLNVTSLDEIAEGENIPAPVAHAILLLAANLYNNREPVTDKTAVKVPLSYEYLLSTYIKY